MELDDLKLKWQEMDSRLANVETLNKQILRDLLKQKVGDNFRQLHLRTSYGLGAGVLVMMIMIPFILNLEPFSVASKYTIVGFLVLSLAFMIYRITLVSHLRITEPTAVLLKYTLLERKAFLVDKFVGMPMVLLLYVLVLCFESSWIIERGKLLEAILMMLLISIAVVYGSVVNNRRYSNLLIEIESQLKELD